jgi:hypothetical protein
MNVTCGGIAAAASCRRLGSEKGTPSGQTFVATKGRDNVKLGASQISVFAGDAVDGLMAGLHTFLAAESKRLRADLAAARAAEHQARLEAEQAGITKKKQELIKKASLGLPE